MTDPAHAADFPAAWAAYQQGGWDGIGFVLREGDGLVVIDLDNCIADDGTLPSTVAALVERAGTFVERSPGGQGLHLIGRLADHARELLPTGRRGTVEGLGKVEIYRTERYIAMTGLRWPATPAELADLSPVVAELVAALDAPRQQRAQPAAPPPQPASPPPVASSPNGAGLSDDDVLALLRRYRHSEDFEALWRGQWQSGGRYQSQSEADLALANLLAWACGPDGRAQAERLWRQSGLAQRAKAQREDYVKRTFDRAYERDEYYEAYPLDLEALRRANAARQAATPAATVPTAPPTPPPPSPDPWAAPLLAMPDAFRGLLGETALALVDGAQIRGTKATLPQRAVLFTLQCGLAAIADVFLVARLPAERSCRTFNLLIAPSGGGKGLALALVRPLLEHVAALLDVPFRVVDGVASGQGLIRALADIHPNPEPPRAALWAEEEVDQVAAAMGYENSTLSAVARKLFDRVTVTHARASERLVVRHVAAGALWHATPEAAGALLQSRVLVGGLANRLLPLRLRGELVVFDAHVPKELIWRLAEPLVGGLRRAAACDVPAAQFGYLTPELEEELAELVRALATEGQQLPPAARDLLRRQWTEVLRIARLYALVEGRAVVEQQDVVAALDWLRAAQEAWLALTATTAQALEAQIVAALANDGGERTLYDLERRLGRYSNVEIRVALERLRREGVVQTEIPRRPGRPSTIVRLLRPPAAPVVRGLRCGDDDRELIAVRGWLLAADDHVGRERVQAGERPPWMREWWPCRHPDGWALVRYGACCPTCGRESPPLPADPPEAGEQPPTAEPLPTPGDDPDTRRLRLCRGCGVPFPPEGDDKICLDCRRLGVS